MYGIILTIRGSICHPSVAAINPRELHTLCCCRSEDVSSAAIRRAEYFVQSVLISRNVLLFLLAMSGMQWTAASPEAATEMGHQFPRRQCTDRIASRSEPGLFFSLYDEHINIAILADVRANRFELFVLISLPIVRFYCACRMNIAIRCSVATRASKPPTDRSPRRRRPPAWTPS